MSINDIKAYCKDPKNQSIVNVGLFILLIFSFHYLYLFWQNHGYWPFRSYVDRLMVWSVDLLYSQCQKVLDYILHIDLITINDSRSLIALDNKGGWANVIVAPECASLKQWLHWVFLMVLFPGPWKHKLWYIPIGLVIIEWTNVIRVCGILLMQIKWPNININHGGEVINTFHLAHDYIFKVFFYLVIFMMWVLWVERFHNPTKTKQQ